MSASVRSLTTSYTRRLLEHWRVPLYRNGYSLVVSSITTSGLGMVYWVLAARYYSTEVIGLNSAIVTSMMFLANISQLNLTNALNRFVPTAGRATSRLVIYAYLISALVGLVVSFVFAVGVGLWAEELGFLKSSPLITLWFAVATMAWCIMVLQNSALTGLRQASWVPLENLVFGLARIGLVIAFASALPRFGVFASWTVPLLLVIVLTNLLIFARLVPQHVRVTEGQAPGIGPWEIARYVGVDYLSSLVWTAAISILPLIVLERAGASANAYFFLCWTIYYSLYLIARNMCMSLIAEAATDETKLAEYSYRVLVQNARLLVPLVLLVVLGAPYLLRLFGDNYASEGTTLLRLLALSALPNIVISTYISWIYVQRRMRRLLLLFSSMCGLTLSLSYVLLDMYGINGIGVAWLFSQSITALVLLFIQRRQMRFPLPGMNSVLRLLTILRGLCWHWTSRRRLDRIAEMCPTILAATTPLASAPPPATWRLQGVVPTVNEVAVFPLGPKGHPPVAILKLPQTDCAAAALRRQSTVLAELHSKHQLDHFRTLLPKILAEGKISGQPYFVETMLPGYSALNTVSNTKTCARFQAAAASAIREFHQRSASSVTVDQGLLQRWVDGPLGTVERMTVAYGQNQRNRDAVHRLSDELHNALAGRTLTVSWVHGDFTPGNILVTPDGASVTGIIDWDQSAPNHLPHLDLVLLLLSTRLLIQRRELGDVIRGLLTDDGWTPQEQALLDETHLALPGDALDVRPVVLLTWLRHIASNLGKSTSYARHWLWVSKNIHGVLSYL